MYVMRIAFRSIATLAMVFALCGAVANIPAAVAQEVNTGAIRVTFRGCPDGPINPNANSLETCTTPLDAPDDANAFWNVGGEGARVNIATDAEREADGTYVIDNVPTQTEVQLLEFHPVAHNNFEIIGGDDTVPPDPWTATLTVSPDSARDIVVFYWNGPDGFSEDDGSTMELTLRGCPEGVDPGELDDPSQSCTVPLDAPENARLAWDMEGGASVANAPRQSNGTYEVTGIPPFQHVGLTGFEPSERDAFLTVGNTYTTEQGVPVVLVARGQVVEVEVYYYFDDAGSGNPGSEPGTIALTLRGCPDGVDPTIIGNPAVECTIPLDAPELAGLIWGGDGQGGLEVRLAPRLNDGTYQLDSVPTGVLLQLVGFEPTERDSFYLVGDKGIVVNADLEFTLDLGEQAHMVVYYFNEP